jgi:hypothetical protein
MVMAGSAETKRTEKFKFHSKEFYLGLENLALKGMVEEDKFKKGIPDRIEAN